MGFNFASKLTPYTFLWLHWHTGGKMLWIPCRVASGLNRLRGYLTLGDISHKIWKAWCPHVTEATGDTHAKHQREKPYRREKRIGLKIRAHWFDHSSWLSPYACPSDLHTQVCAKNSPVVEHMPGKKKKRYIAYLPEHTKSERFMDECDFCLQVL